MKKLPALAGAAALLCCAPSTQAGAQSYQRARAHATLSVKVLNDVHVGTSKRELLAQKRHSTHVIRFFQVGHHWLPAPRHGSCTTVPWMRSCLRARAVLTAHLWLRHVAETRYHRLYAPKPAPVVSASASHMAMWLCIHGKEGAWDANTGNGYYGGLQATSPWYGVSRMDLLSPGAQIAHAEAMYAANGYSLGWIRQQWPNTSYGCV